MARPRKPPSKPKRKGKTFSYSFMKEVERFNKQKRTLAQLETAYDTFTDKYYARNKRRNLLGNQFDIVKNINPMELSPMELRAMVRSNVQAIRTLGFTSQMSDDYAQALVLTQLNNEAFRATNWYHGSPNAFDDENEASIKQEEVMANMLFQQIRPLNLTSYQLKRVLDQSILDSHHKDNIRASIRDYWKKLRN